MFKKMFTFLKQKEAVVKKTAMTIPAACAALGLVPTVYADNSTATTNSAALNKTMGEILSVVFTIFRYIGIVLAIWGVGALVMAFKNEDADSKSRAIMSLVVGVVLIFLKTIATPIMNAANIPMS